MTFEEIAIEEAEKMIRFGATDKEKVLAKVAIAAINKQTPKKPKVISDYGICCNTEGCGFIFAFTENALKVMGDLVQYDYCPCCGQKIDWSDYK